jgi:hypothetical protein
MTRDEILHKVANHEIDAGEALVLLDSLQPKAQPGKITYKVSEKGALSAYGLQRMPVTLYVEQWERLDVEDERKRRQEFIKAHAKELARKS